MGCPVPVPGIQQKGRSAFQLGLTSLVWFVLYFLYNYECDMSEFYYAL